MREQGAQLLAISTDTMEDAERMADLARATFPVLADADRRVTTSYGLFDLLGDGVSAPATLILDSRGDLAGRYVGSTIDDRPSAGAILDFLEELNGRAQPDA